MKLSPSVTAGGARRLQSPHQFGVEVKVRTPAQTSTSTFEVTGKSHFLKCVSIEIQRRS